jgi:hypothetical protein
VVLVMSLGFIGFVTALHVIGKLYHYRAGVWLYLAIKIQRSKCMLLTKKPLFLLNC